MALTTCDVAAMYSLLTNSMSADHRVRAPAEEALAQSDSRPGFCSCLLEVITANDLASQTDVRMMATVYFKNSVTRYWRHSRDSSGISNEEKTHLRQKLLTYLREENDQIALMLAVLISKIARFDYPKEWYFLIFISLAFKNICSAYNAAKLDFHLLPSLTFLFHCLFWFTIYL